jgi:hypothetical protein
LVDKDKHALIRKREDYAGLIALEDKEDD